MVTHRQHPFTGVGLDQAAVDQAAQRPGKGQRAGGGQYQKRQGQADAQTVGPQEGEEAGE